METLSSLDKYGPSVQNIQVYVIRDLLKSIKEKNSLEALLLWGARQVGKTTLLSQLELSSEAYLDDLSARTRAQSDPQLFLDAYELPCLIDEVQYAPNLFPEIKLRIDRVRRSKLSLSQKPQTDYYLTGSNRLMLEKKVQESLAGRCHLFELHGLSVKEINQSLDETPLKKIIFYGGLPELYKQPDINVVQYLNDYIRSFIEKDTAQSSGVEKIEEFLTVLQMLAARTGQFLNLSELSKNSGVEQKTIQSWISILERNFIIKLLRPYSSNLSKRLTRMRKLFFLDTGICVRLQGHLNADTTWNSPQMGSLFETLVFSEIIKTRDYFLKNWHIHTWRTKDKSEIDFLIQTNDLVIFLEAKLAIHSAKAFPLDREALKVFSGLKTQKIVVTSGGQKVKISQDTLAIPINELGQYLLETI